MRNSKLSPQRVTCSDKTQNSKLNERGSALIITLLLVTILISLVTEFAYEVYIGTSALSNWQNAKKASFLARSGLALTSNYIDDLKDHAYTEHKEISLPVKKELVEEGVLNIKVIDENSKFHINSIIYPNGLTNDSALSSLKKLLEYLNIKPSLADYIADWIDPDSEPRIIGSEYEAKNSYLWSIEELKLIKGIDEEVFKTIKPYITVHSSGLININTAELPVLVSLSDNMTETLAKRIIDYRGISPFEDKTHIVRISGLEAIGIQIQDRITVKSSDFRVITSAEVNGITRIIESVMNTSMTIQYWREG